MYHTTKGELLRRYWWPIAISAHLKDKPTFIRSSATQTIARKGGVATVRAALV